MQGNLFDMASFVTQTAAVNGISLDPERHAQVVATLLRVEEMAELIMSFDLPDKVEIAPVFAL